MFKFIHAADLHLDSPLHGLEHYEGAPVDVIRGATRRALENLVLLAIDQEVRFVLLAGDQYDRDQDDYRTVMFFTRQMQRLCDAGIAVFAIDGNHDAAIKRPKSLRLPDNVQFLPNTKAKSVPLDDLGVTIHGRGFAKQAETDNLVNQYPPGNPGHFNIGLLHTALTGREGHHTYAPCDLDADLRKREYDYWALGHVHGREEVCKEPFVIFPGNIQGRNIRETGEKGCFLVTVGDDRRITPDFMPLDVFRWEVCPVPVNGAQSEDEIVERVIEELGKVLQKHPDHPLGVRVRVEGPTALHGKIQSDVEKWTYEIRMAAQGLNADRLWLEKTLFQTRPRADAASRQLEGPLAELQAYIGELRSDDTQLAELGRELDELRRKLPPDPTRDNQQLLPNDLQWLQTVLDDVKTLLVERLTREESMP